MNTATTVEYPSVHGGVSRVDWGLYARVMQVRDALARLTPMEER